MARYGRYGSGTLGVAPAIYSSLRKNGNGQVCHVIYARRVAQLVSVNRAHVMVATWKQDVARTGIDKRPASGRVRVFDHHVDGPPRGILTRVGVDGLVGPSMHARV